MEEIENPLKEAEEKVADSTILFCQVGMVTSYTVWITPDPGPFKLDPDPTLYRDRILIQLNIVKKLTD